MRGEEGLGQPARPPALHDNPLTPSAGRRCLVLAGAKPISITYFPSHLEPIHPPSQHGRTSRDLLLSSISRHRKISLRPWPSRCPISAGSKFATIPRAADTSHRQIAISSPPCIPGPAHQTQKFPDQTTLPHRTGPCPSLSFPLPLSFPSKRQTPCPQCVIHPQGTQLEQPPERTRSRAALYPTLA